MQPESAKIIDVVEDFSCPEQSEAYCEAFRSWRRRKHNPYAFRFTKNPKEASFSEAQPAADSSPAQAEYSVIRRLGYLTGIALVLYLVIENILDKLLVLVMQAFHLHIEVVFWGEARYFGEERLVFWLVTLIRLMKYAVPAAAIWFALRLPMRVGLPLRVKHPPRLLLGICLTMLVSVALSVFTVSRSAELEKYRMIYEVIGTPDYVRVIIYLLSTIFILPLAAELLLHGWLFQVLRQFGDQFAMIVTAALAALLTHDLQDALRVGLITLLISYILIRTGSFLTALILRIVHEIYLFALFYFETYGGIYSLQWWITVLVPCAMGVAALVYMQLRRTDLAAQHTDGNETYLSMTDKASAFFTAIPMMCCTIACVLLLVISFMLR